MGWRQMVNGMRVVERVEWNEGSRERVEWNEGSRERGWNGMRRDDMRWKQLYVDRCIM